MRRWQPLIVLLLVISLVAAGVAVVVLSRGQDDTKSTADENTERITQLQAETARLRTETARLKAQQQREAAERARLRTLIADLGGDPGPDLRPTNGDRDLDLGTPTPSPQSSPRSSPSPKPSPSRRPSPSPSPSCVRVPPVPLSVCR